MIQDFDYSILQWIFDSFRGGVSDSFWLVVTSLGNGCLLWLVTAAVLLCFPKTRRCGIAVLCAILISALIGSVAIKYLVQRERPFITYPELQPLLLPFDRFSFPSGHATTSFAAATVLCVRFHWKGAVAYIPAMMIGFSRLYCCIHYPTDVLAGLVLGIGCGLLAVKITQVLLDELHYRHIHKA